MMWTDTVMDTIQIHDRTGIDITETNMWERIKPMLERQAEISFKAGMVEESTGGTNSVSYLAGTEHGYAEGYNKCLAQLAGMTEECKQMGRKDVADWIEDNWGMTPAEKQLWNNQLKKWGK